MWPGIHGLSLQFHAYGYRLTTERTNSCKEEENSWFQAVAVFCMLYAFFWVITQKKAYNKRKIIYCFQINISVDYSCIFSPYRAVNEILIGYQTNLLTLYR